MRSHAERGNDLTFDCDQMWERACSRIALLILLAARSLKLLAALVQLAHQLRFSLGQPARLSQFIDAGAHAYQFRRLGE